jgi:hypothetical protein
MLDSTGHHRARSPTHPLKPMGQQSNKHIKKKRRIAYHKRKKEAALAAKKPAAKAKK